MTWQCSNCETHWAEWRNECGLCEEARGPGLPSTRVGIKPVVAAAPVAPAAAPVAVPSAASSPTRSSGATPPSSSGAPPSAAPPPRPRWRSAAAGLTAVGLLSAGVVYAAIRAETAGPKVGDCFSYTAEQVADPAPMEQTSCAQEHTAQAAAITAGNPGSCEDAGRWLGNQSLVSAAQAAVRIWPFDPPAGGDGHGRCDAFRAEWTSGSKWRMQAVTGTYQDILASTPSVWADCRRVSDGKLGASTACTGKGTTVGFAARIETPGKHPGAKKVRAAATKACAAKSSSELKKGTKPRAFELPTKAQWTETVSSPVTCWYATSRWKFAED